MLVCFVLVLYDFYRGCLWVLYGFAFFFQVILSNKYDMIWSELQVSGLNPLNVVPQ